MSRLGFLLSFYFGDDETSSILNDYDDWFTNEAALGKSEPEICAALESPGAIVKNLRLESGKGTSVLNVFFHSTMLQMFVLMALQMVAGILLLKYCNRNVFSFLYFALDINFLYFLAGVFIIPKGCPFSFSDYKENLPVLMLVVLVLLLEIFAVPKLKHPTFGPVCVLILGIITFILFLAELFCIIQKTELDKLCAFITVFHMTGTITMLWFAINQFHMLYQDMSEYTDFIYSSIGIYLETVVLCLLLCVIKRQARKE